MRNDVFELLCFFDGKEAFGKETVFFLFLTLLGLKFRINTHKTCHSSNVLIFEGFKKF